LQADLELSNRLGRVMPADEDYGETELRMQNEMRAESGDPAMGFTCVECRFEHKDFAVILNHAVKAHTSKFRAVTSNATVLIRKDDVDRANAKLAKDMAELARERSYTCRVCKFSDGSIEKLKEHVRSTHTKTDLDRKRKIGTDKDDGVESPAKKLKKMERKNKSIEEGEEMNIVFRCKHCNFKSTKVSRMKSHRREAHPKKSKKTGVPVVKTSSSSGIDLERVSAVRDIKKEAGSGTQKLPIVEEEAKMMRKKKSVYACRFCFFKATTCNGIKLHVSDEHPGQKKKLGRPKKKDAEARLLKTEPSSKTELKCKKCDFSTTHLPSMRQHVLISHPTKEREAATKCFVCGHRADTNQNLQTHAKAEHFSQDDGLFHCNVCDYRKKYFKCLNKHAETYPHEIPHEAAYLEKNNGGKPDDAVALKKERMEEEECGDRDPLAID
jgi:hypothetical protein